MYGPTNVLLNKFKLLPQELPFTFIDDTNFEKALGVLESDVLNPYIKEVKYEGKTLNVKPFVTIL